MKLALATVAMLAWLASGGCRAAADGKGERSLQVQRPSPDASLDQPPAGLSGDAARGRTIVASRQAGLCLLCHAAPIPEERFQGNLGPDLAGAGSRWKEGELRLRILDASALNPDTIMPSYGRTDGLNRVSRPLQGKALLDPQQIEDVVAYLLTLK
jgi:L-cysteine S-thiosulfotransferase